MWDSLGQQGRIPQQQRMQWLDSLLQYLQQSRANLLHTSFGFITPCLMGCCNTVYPCLGKFFCPFTVSLQSVVWFLLRVMCSLCQGVTVAGWRSGRKAESSLFHECLLHCKSYTLKAMLKFIEFWSAQCFLFVFSFGIKVPITNILIQCILCQVPSSRIRSCPARLVLSLGSRSCSGHGCCQRRRRRCWERAPRCRLCNL